MDGTSSLAVSGDFFNYESATAEIDGAFVVKGTLHNAYFLLMDGPSSIHSVQNNGIMRAGEH